MSIGDALRALRCEPEIRGIVVAPDVFEKIQRYADDASNPAIDCGGGVEVFVNRMLAPGTIVPIDAKGNPIPRGSKVRLR